MFSFDDIDCDLNASFSKINRGYSYLNSYCFDHHNDSAISTAQESENVTDAHTSNNTTSSHNEKSSTTQASSERASDEYAQDKFKWSEDAYLAFALVATYVGVYGIKPKNIVKLFPTKFGLNAYQIGSHLQKYRIKLVKDYNLCSFDDIQNWMVPTHLKDEQLMILSNEWRTRDRVEARKPYQ